VAEEPFLVMVQCAIMHGFMDKNPIIIEAADELHALIEEIRHEPCVALDTELVWERTFYPHLGLVQVGRLDGDCYLLDAVKLPDMAPLGRILTDPNITKILHDAVQDLQILFRATGAAPVRIFDTQVAAGFAGMSHLLSLQKLIAELLGIMLPKDQTRTNWLRRPLRPRQIEYAADDVRYLPEIHDLLRRKAAELKTEEWMDEELALLDDPSLYEERDPHEQYHRIRAASSLRPRQLAILRELTAWRERHARSINRPRGRVVEDRELVAVACGKADRVEDLHCIPNVDPKTAKRHGSELLAAVQRGRDIPEGELPSRPKPRNTRRVSRDRVETAVGHIRARCEERGIDPAMVATKGEIALMLLDGRDAEVSEHRPLHGWRAELLSNSLASIFHEELPADEG